MKKYQVLLGLGVLVMALWTVIAPVHADGKSLVGSWVWVNCDTACEGNTDVICNVNEPWPAICGNYNVVNVCAVNSNGSGTCTGEDQYPCVGNYACSTAEDTYCGY